MQASPISTLDLDHLLGLLRDHPEQTLRLIDEDPKLKRRELSNGLVIANASASLFEPVCEHQLLAKGIVYARDPLRLVSLPLVKMFNHGLREHSDATSQALVARPDVRMIYPEKLDGTMVQYFGFEGRTYLTTRSILEGTEVGEDESIYLRLAREQIATAHPELLDPEALQGLSLIFELIHPRTKQVTNYGADKRMVLLSVFDHSDCTYWSNQRVFEWADRRGISRAKMLLGDVALLDGVAQLHEQLATDPDVPEGSIVCFERGDRIVHRVKVKTADYLELFAARYKITYKGVVQMLWEDATLRDWGAFLAHLIEKGQSEEEVEAFYREHFDAFTQWYARVEASHERLRAAYDELTGVVGVEPEGGEARRVWFKALAGACRERHPEDFAMVMNWARKGGLSLEQVMWQDLPYPGFRAALTEAGVRV